MKKSYIVLLTILPLLSCSCNILVKDKENKVSYGKLTEGSNEPVMYEFNGQVGRMYSAMIFYMKNHAVSVNIRKNGTSDWYAIDLVDATDDTRTDAYAVGVVKVDRIFFKNLAQEDYYRVYVFL